MRGTINFFRAGRAVAMRIEPGVGGRVLEIDGEARSDALERGLITVWKDSAEDLEGRRWAFAQARPTMA